MSIVTIRPTDIFVHSSVSHLRLLDYNKLKPLDLYDEVKRYRAVKPIYCDTYTVVPTCNIRYYTRWEFFVPEEFREYLTFYNLKGYEDTGEFVQDLFFIDVVFDGPVDLAVMWRLLL